MKAPVIVWRLDDLHFAGQQEALPLDIVFLRRMFELFEQKGGRTLPAVITRFLGCSSVDDPDMLNLLQAKKRQGHLPAAHGVVHDPAVSYTDMTDEGILDELTLQKADLKAANLETAWFCYPFNHRDERTDTLVRRSGFRIVQSELSQAVCISTVTTWKNPAVSSDKLHAIVETFHRGNDVMVEDHPWLYRSSDDLRLLVRCLDTLPFGVIRSIDDAIRIMRSSRSSRDAL
jgi:hypothetical protein